MSKIDQRQIRIKDVVAFTVMVFGMFMAILDIQIVSSSLNEIQAGLSASSDEISWVQTAYLIAEVIMIPLSGFLNRLLSTRNLFTISAFGFTLSSLLCATATSMDQMMIYRALQGFIGGGMIPTVFVSVYIIFPADKQKLVSPLVGLIVTLAPTIGPTVGGYLSDSFSWQWLFLINVPLGIIVTVMGWITIDIDKGDKSLFKKMDWIGIISMAVFLGSLEYVLEEGPQHDWLQDNTILTLAITMVIGAVIFFYRVLTYKEPIVDLFAFKNLNFAMGSFFSFALGVGLYGLTYMYPLYLGRVQHYTAYMIGTTMFISGLSMFAGAPLAAILSNRFDQRYVMGLGFMGFALCTYISSGITDNWSFDQLLLPQILRGISMMLCIVPINNVALGTLPIAMMKNASSLYNLTRNLGGAIGLGIINTILINRGAFHYERLSESLNYGNKIALETLHNLTMQYSSLGKGSAGVALAKLASITHDQATIMSLADCFFLLSMLFSVLSFCVLLVKKPKGNVDAAH